MDKIVLIDTNLYLDDSNVIFKLANEYEKILIPHTVLKELDRHKFNRELSYSARQAIRAILNFKSECADRTIFDPEHYSGISEPDEKIIASAKNFGADIATKDISMSISANSQGVDTKLQDIILNNIFNPYTHVHMEDLHMATEDDIFSYQSEYTGDDYNGVLSVFSKLSGRELEEDCWWFVIILTGDEKQIIYANNPLKNKIERIDDKPKYRQIMRDRDLLVKALDTYQICAIYAMIEAPNALICGSYGSGKSLISTAYSLAYNDNKTFISRPNLTVDRRFELGFLPGPLEDKLTPWMAGFMSSLYHMFSNTKGQTSEKMGGITYDFVKEQIFKRYFDMIPLETLQGMSFMDGYLLLLDESQLCSVSILSVILSRFGKGSKLIMTGDVNQTYGVIPPSENGLLKLLRLLPNKALAYVELKNNYRTELLELADSLQNKSF